MLRFLNRYFNKDTWNQIFFPSLVIGMFIVVIVAIGLYSYENAKFFNSMPVNGGFQHFNPLRRLFNGEIPGVDFPVFHGTLLTLVFSPVYFLFGQNLFASEFSRYLMQGLSILTVNILFVGLLPGKISRYVKILIAVILTMLFSYVGFLSLLDPIGSAYSSLGVRTLFPILGIYLISYFLKSNNSSLSEKSYDALLVAMLSLMAAIIVLFTTEQGMAFFLGVSAAIFFVYPRNGTWIKRLTYPLAFFIGTFTFFILLSSIYSFGSPTKIVHTIFSDIPKDQIWYFGVPPNRMLTSLRDFYSSSYADTDLPKQAIIFILSSIILFLNFTAFRKKYTAIDRFILIVMFFYGIFTTVSILGYYSAHYFQPFTRINLFIIIYSCFVLLRSERKIASILLNILMAIAILVLLLPGKLNLGLRIESLKHLYTKNNLHEYSGVYLSGIWENFFPNMEKQLGLPKKELNISSFTDGLFWKNGVYKNTYILISPENIGDIRLGDSVLLNEVSYKIVNIDYENSSILIDGYIESGINEGHITIIPGESRSTKVTILPTYGGINANGEKETQFSNFINGVRLVDNLVYFSVENSYSNLIHYGSGDKLILSGNREVNLVGLKNTSPSVLIGTYSGFVINNYSDGYPNDILLKPLSRQEKKVKLVQITDENYTNGVYPIFGINLVNNNQSYYYAIGDYLMNEKLDKCIITDLDTNGNIFCGNSKLEFEKVFIMKAGYILKDTDIWSHYSGILEDIYGVFNPSGVDYIVHVLGKENRKEYLKNFIDISPKFVHIIRNDYWGWENASIASSWGFYEYLLKNYKIATYTNFSILWKKTLKPIAVNETPWYEVVPKEGDQYVTIPVDIFNTGATSSGTLTIIKVEYDIENNLSKIPMIGNTPRYFIIPDSKETPLPVSLPPYESSWTFPVYTMGANELRLGFSSVSPLPVIKGKLSVKSVKYKFMYLPQESIDGLFYSKFNQKN